MPVLGRQRSADNGTPGDWHLAHLGQLAMSGAGLLILEATAVSAVGRITDGDLGLYSDANEAGLARILGALRAISGMPIAMQIGHAGRKASSRAPWHGGLQIPLAAQLGAQVSVPHQYWRSQPRGLKDLFKVASFGQG